MNWDMNWLWSIPLILVTVAVHVLGLGYVAKQIILNSSPPSDRREFMIAFCTVVGSTTLLAMGLLAVHAASWALLYLSLGALPDATSAVLYSLSALTSYGHAELFLEKRWQLMGALEAVNGMLLFGLTTAFLFATIQAVWPIGRRQ
jgi:hypothetical protein